MARQLVDVDVQFISLVKKAANKEQITIYKSADYNPENSEKGVEPMGEEIKKANPTPEGLLKVLKSFFFGDKEKEETPVTVEKASDINTEIQYDSFNSRMNGVSGKLWDAEYTLESVVSEIMWDSKPNGKERISTAIDEFKAYVMGVLDQPEEVAKSFFSKKEEIKKEEDSEMKAEEIKELLAPITKSIEDLSTKVDGLSKQTEVVEKSVEEHKEEVKETVQKTEEKVTEKATEVAKAAEQKDDELKELLTKSLETLQKSVDGISERVNTLEEVRGISKQAPANKTDVQKAADEWPIL